MVRYVSRKGSQTDLAELECSWEDGEVVATFRQPFDLLAQTSVKGLRIYLSDGEALPVEVAPPLSARKYWSRRGIVKHLLGSGLINAQP
jgi:hypothetical protein